jgi:hypothetical protein
MSEMYKVTKKELKAIKKLCEMNTPLTNTIQAMLMKIMMVKKDDIERFEQTEEFKKMKEQTTPQESA